MEQLAGSTSAPTVRFITDEPADKDSFATHSVLAGAIAEAILTNPTLKVIGLLGRWGSGKSTVVRYLVTRIENLAPKRFKVFTYDAWLHQHDSPRRSFLENLVSSLDQDGLIDSAKWQTELKFLSGVLQKQDKVETPVFTRDAKFLFLVLLPVPFALSLIGVDTFAGTFGAQRNLAAIWSFWIAIALISFPALMWSARTLFLRLILKKPAEWFPPFLINRQLERNSTLIERTPDPDSLDFGRQFRDLMIDVSSEGRKLIIVIDNIDRIGDDDALAMWANIRSFFLAAQGTDMIGHEPFHPIVLLPVDDQAIRRLFTSKHGNAEAADSFLSKTFDASFTVPTPVMSDWRAFLAAQLQHAFNNSLTDQQIFQIRRILEEGVKTRRREDGNQTPRPLTPREINRFINSLLSLYLQWRDSGIGLIVMAYFAVFREDIDGDIMKFVLSHDRSLASMDRDWQKKVAALHFGVAVEKAAQVLIEEPLIEAITNYDGLTFREYSEIPGFGDVFADLTAPFASPVVEDQEAAWFYLNAADLLSRQSFEDVPVWAIVAWQNLGRAIPSTIRNVGLSSALNERLRAALPHLADPAVRALVSPLSLVLSRELSDESAFEKAPDVRELVSMIAERGGESEGEFADFAVTSTAEHFLRLLITFRDHDYIQERLRLDSPEEHNNVAQELVSLAQDGDQIAGLPWLIDFLWDDESRERANLADVNWEPINSYVTGIVQDLNSALARSGAALPLVANLAAVSEAGADTVGQGVDQGWVGSILDEALKRQDENEIAAGYAILIWRRRDLPNPDYSWRVFLNRYPGLTEKVLKHLRDINDDDSLEPIADCYEQHYSARGFLEELMTHQIETADLGSIYTDRVGNDFWRYGRMLSLSLRDRFIDLLLEYDDFEETLRTAPWGEGLNSVADHLSQQGEEKAREVRAIILKRLIDSDGEDLKSALEDGDEPFRAIVEMQERESLGMPAESGPYRLLDSHIAALPTESEDVIARWFRLHETINPRQRRDLVDRLGEVLLTAEPARSLECILAEGGRSLLSSRRFLIDPDRAVERILLPALRTKRGRTVMKKYKGLVARWAIGSDPKTKRALHKRLETLASSSSYERNGFAKAVIGAWTQ